MAHRLTVTLCMALLSGCTHLFFHPVKQHLQDPHELGLQVQDVWFNSKDGVRLHGWFMPAQQEAAGTVIFAHGNAQNISTHIGSVYTLPQHGLNVFLFDYRGYGRSQGEPSVPGLIRDTQAALAYAASHDARMQGPLFIFGQSLGASISICALARSAYRERIAALVLDSGFASFRGIAREKLSSFWLTWPLQWPLAQTVTDECRPKERIGELSPIPLVIVHSRDDAVIPFRHAEALYAAAEEPKSLWPTRHHAHNRIFADTRNQELLARYFLKFAPRRADSENSQ